MLSRKEADERTCTGCGYMDCSGECKTVSSNEYNRVCEMNKAKRAEISQLKNTLSKALRSICLTRDYVGEALLPPIDGWEWYDAGNAISELIPDDEWTKQFKLRTNDK